MGLARRDFLRLAGWGAMGMGMASCAPLYARLAGSAALDAWPEATGEYALLRRLTFGPRPEERRRSAEIGLQAWVEEQLAPETLDDGGAWWRLRNLDALDLGADALEALEAREAVGQLRRGTLLRQVYSRRQLYEMMVSFWTDHFNISVAKGDCWFLKVVDDREVIRAHALGNFRDLLWASAHSPAMLVYLDNQVNDRRAPNENYARELMELHTLGVDGGYTQRDVMEMARALTGWTVKEHFWRGQFTFNEGMHDAGGKQILDMRIEPAGQREAEQVLERLALHPATARHLAWKLVQRFVNDDPSRELDLVGKVAASFLRTGGDMRAVLRTLLMDGLLGREGSLPVKLKRPLDFVASALRQVGAQSDGGRPLHQALARMGQPLFGWPTPDGPPDRAEAWMGGLMARWRFAAALAFNELGGTRVEVERLLEDSATLGLQPFLQRAAALLLGVPLGEGLAAELARALGAVEGPEAHRAALAVMLASPAFQRR